MRFHSRAVRLLGGCGLTAALIVSWAVPAWADTSQATANALTATLGGGPLLNSGTCSATNDGTTGQQLTNCGPPAVAVPITGPSLTIGVLAQNAAADNNGGSKACAGAVGAGGRIQIGTTQPCTVNLGTPAGVQVGGPTGITADAILAFCSASSTGAPTGGASLIAANLGGGAVLPANPTPGSSPGPGITLNEQTTLPNGQIQVTALDINIPGVVQAKIGNVTCGPNARAGAGSLFPTEGLPIAGGMIALAGVGFFWVRRRRVVSRVS